MRISSVRKAPQRRGPKSAESSENNSSSVQTNRGRGPSAKEVVTWTAAASVPILGAGVHYLSILGKAHNSDNSGEKISIAGAFANLLGTVALGAGIITGSNGATAAGLGLLASSGAALLLANR